MTAMEIATGMLDKLNEENRTCLESLHRAQDEIRYKERQLSEKDRLIKMLEERIRTGNDGILEMTNRQKELTIKNLELQIEKLLKENEDLSYQLEAIKSEICPKCETRLLLRENKENRSSSKLYKTSGKSSGLFETKSAQSLCPSRAKDLQRIIEHKDRRIAHLSKEVQRLSKAEKELTQKVYRLTKLLPMSRLPPETLTECLLKEIQSLETQKENCKSSIDRIQALDELRKPKKTTFTSHASTSKTSTLKSSDRLQKSSTSSLKPTTSYVSESQQAVSDINRVENEVLYKKLQKLCNDINELKRLFAFESEKLSEGLQSTAAEYDSFKTHLEEIVDNLNDVMKSILNNSVNLAKGYMNDDTSEDSDDKYVISCLQKRLKECLELVTKYEHENKALKEKLNECRAQLAKQEPEPRQSSDRWFKTFNDSKIELNTNDASKLKEIIRLKESQLESAESHINTCQKFIEELQKNIKHMTFDSSQKHSASASEEKKANAYEQEIKMLKTKLDVAEKNIKTCENVIEQLLDSVRSLEEENVRIESELHIAKAKAFEEPTSNSGSLHSKLTSYSDTCINTLKNLNQELKDKVKFLEEANSRLSANLKSPEVEILEQERSFTKSKLEASEKHICTLQKSVESLQAKLKKVELEKAKLEAEVKELKTRMNLAEKYEDDVVALKNELNLKEDENKELKESLVNLENKALEMNHYRKSLHEEIETLCKALMESEETEDSTRRKEIYKAAVLRSAQALLHLDDDYNFKPEDSGRNSALDELKHQIQVYLTEVARIHELVTIKEHERDELLKQYLDLPDDSILRPSPSLHHVYHSKEMPDIGNLQSSTDFQASEKTDARSNKEIEALQEELVATKSVASYLVTNCSRIESLHSREKEKCEKYERELEKLQETVKSLKSQLNMRSNWTKNLSTLIEKMRCKECNDEITVELLKKQIKGLVDENQKIFERVTSTQSELNQCKEENLRVQNDLESLKRQLLNEKYEHAKVNNELRHLQIQIDNSRSALGKMHLN